MCFLLDAEKYIFGTVSSQNRCMATIVKTTSGTWKAVMLIAAFVLMYLTNKIPPRISGIVGVGGVGSIGGVGVGSVMAAAAMTASAAASVGSSVLAGATNGAGGASALQVAFQRAQRNMAEGRPRERACLAAAAAAAPAVSGAVVLASAVFLAAVVVSADS